MGRPTTKDELMTASQVNYENLNTIIDSMTETELSEPFDFKADVSKKEAHWKRDKNLRDVLIHLYEWHNLLLKWIERSRSGEKASFIPQPYNWRTYGDMNIEFWKNHQSTTLEAAKSMLEQSHRKVMELAQTFSNEELFSKEIYPWVGSSTLGSYFTSVTASHYVWAVKKLKAHRKNCKNKD